MIATEVAPPASLLGRLLARLRAFHGDGRGQILPLVMFVGIAFCIGTGLVMNTGRVVNRRIEAQNAVDAAAVSGASCVARGMNFIARNNVTMAKVLVTVVIVRSFRPAIMASRIVLLVLEGVAIGMQVLAKILEAIPFTEPAGAVLDTIATVLKRKIAQEKKVLRFLYKWMVQKIAKKWDDEILTGRLAGSGRGYGWKFLRGLALFGDVLAYATPVYAQLTTKAVFGANARPGGITDRDAWLFPLYPSLPICKGAFASYSEKVQYGTPKASHFIDLTVGVEPIANMIGVASILPLTLSGFWVGYPVTAHLELKHLFGAGPVNWSLPGLPDLHLCEEDGDDADGPEKPPEDPDATPPLPIPADEQANVKRQIDAIGTYPKDQDAWDAASNPYRYAQPGGWDLGNGISSPPPVRPGFLAGDTAPGLVSSEAAAAGRTDVVTDIGLQKTMRDGVRAGAPLNTDTTEKTAKDGENDWLPDLIETKEPHTSKSDRIRQYDRLMKRDQKVIDVKQQLLYGSYPQGSPALDAEGKPVPLGEYEGRPIDAGNHAPPNGLVREVADADALIALKKQALAAARAASKDSDPDKDDATVVRLQKELTMLQNRRDYLDGQRYELEADVKKWNDDKVGWQTKLNDTIAEEDKAEGSGEDAEPASDPANPPKRPELTKRFHPYLLEGPAAWPRSFTYFALGYRNITDGTFLHGDIRIPKDAQLFGHPKMPGFRDGDVLAVPGIGALGNYAFTYAAARVYNSLEGSVDMWTANWSARLVRVEFKNLPRNPLGHLPRYCSVAPDPHPAGADPDPAAADPAADSGGCAGTPDPADDGEGGGFSGFLEDCFGITLPGIPNPMDAIEKLIREMLPDWNFDTDWKLTLPLAPGALNKH